MLLTIPVTCSRELSTKEKERAVDLVEASRFAEEICNELVTVGSAVETPELVLQSCDRRDHPQVASALRGRGDPGIAQKRTSIVLLPRHSTARLRVREFDKGMRSKGHQIMWTSFMHGSQGHYPSWTSSSSAS